MTLRFLLAALVASMVVAGPAFADWRGVGSVDVAARGADKDRVEAAFDQPASKLRFTAAGDVSCRHIRVSFETGKKQRLDERAFKAGVEQVVELAGPARVLKRIEFNCRTARGAMGTIEVAAFIAGAPTAGVTGRPRLQQTTPGVTNVVIQGSQANEGSRVQPGAAPVAVEPVQNVVIQGSQANEGARVAPGAEPVAVQPVQNVVIQNSQVNSNTAPSAAGAPVAAINNAVVAPAQGSVPGVVMTTTPCPAPKTGGAIAAMQGAAAQNQGGVGGIQSATPGQCQ